MEKKLIDEVLEDIAGDDGFQDMSEEDKQAMAVLLYLYNNQIKAVAGEEWKDTIIEEWLEKMGFDEYVNLPKIFNRLQNLNILTKEKRFKKKKEMSDGMLWILFGSVLRGSLECSFSDGEYRFKISEQGVKEVMELLEHKKEGD